MKRVLALMVLMSALSVAALAQTRESGPWWPQPGWGPEDQAGASNRITPDKVIDALGAATTGQIYELGQVYAAGMPLYGTRSYSLNLVSLGAPQGSNAVVGNDEFIATQVGQVGTQFDGLGHIGAVVEFEDGSTDRVFYNGFTASEMDAPDGLLALGVERLRPIVTRGVLIDVAGYKGMSRLEGGYEVTLADVRGALERQGLSEDSIESGDAVLFNYGWSALWNDPEAYNGDIPGIGLEVASWLAGLEITVTGSDAWATEVVPNPDPALAFPVHQELMMKNGIFNIENMQFGSLLADEVYEFLFIATPIRFRGATGSPLRPIAIR